MHPYRTHLCDELRASDVGETVRLAGWVHRVRDHGGVLFVDLRDHYGTTQVLADSDSPAFSQMERVRAEWCIRIDGTVKARAPELVNAKIPTGEVEVFVRDLEVLGPAEELPLQVFGEPDYPEETRLRFRYLDLRRDALHANMVLRSDVVRSVRERMWGAGFREYQTPIITASSPEGARDFLVPSRLHPGRFYALPQAPQIFKQLIMVSGFDRYFQIAPCFRDEDPRADRSPTDFYQLDMEMSFVTQEDVFATIEPVIAGLFEQFGEGRTVDAHWPRIPFAEALRKYGTDKPDLRNPIEMQDVSEHFRGSGFAIFARILEQDGTEVRAIPAPGGGSRKFCDRMNAWAQAQGLPGMGYIFWRARANPLAQSFKDALDRTSSVLQSVSGNQEQRVREKRRFQEAAREAAEKVSLTDAEAETIIDQIDELRETGDEDGASFLRAAYFGDYEPAGPLAKNIGPERTEAIRRQLDLGPGDAAFFLAGRPEDFEAVAGRARTEVGRGAWPHRRVPLRLRLDRRLPDVRARRGGGRGLLPQPLLDAPRRAGGAGGRSPAGAGLPVRPRLQRLRDRVGRDPQPPPRRDVPRLRGRGLLGRGGRAPLPRAPHRLPLRRAAARRLCCRHRPHRDAARRRREHPRGHHVPHDPAGRGPDDGRPHRAHAGAASGAAPARPAAGRLMALRAAAVPPALRALARADALLDVAEGTDPAALGARLDPDRFDCAEQIRAVADFALRATLPLAGREVPEVPERADPRASLAFARCHVEGLSEAEFDGAEARRIRHRAGFADLDQTGAEYLHLFALPNLWFHLSVAHATLKVAGVSVGKADFDGFHAYPAGFSFAPKA